MGTLGKPAFRWIEWLQQAGCSLWQILPLNPPGPGNSPYQSFSAYAGNPWLISLESLVEEGLVDKDALHPIPDFPNGQVDYRQATEYKDRLLSLLTSRFSDHAPGELRQAFRAFCEQHAGWLDDFSLFMALKKAHKGSAWTGWEHPYASRDPAHLESAREELADDIEDEKIRQFLFSRQWQEVRERAHEAGIQIIGDIPIFVAHDSADVWANPRSFHLDASGQPTVVAGVPPDYFSKTGQLWGNPIYQWERMRAEGFRWWIGRLEAVLSQVDLVRLDHFRGFEAYWEIPASAATAEAGRWVKGPGTAFLQHVQDALGNLPIIAEDLGVITPEVTALRETFNLPGMKVLQFAFGGDPEHAFLPHNYPQRCVVYTGTHDNDTSRGWFDHAPDSEKDFCRRYLDVEGEDIAWDLIRAAWSSVADIAIAPLQDLLDLGSEARMNFPSRPEGNWSWRIEQAALTPELAHRLHDLNHLFGRLPDEQLEGDGGRLETSS